MFFEKIKDLNIAEIISHYGSAPEVKDRTFLMYRDEGGNTRQITYEDYFQRSLDYAKMIQRFRTDQGRSDGDRA